MSREGGARDAGIELLPGEWVRVRPLDEILATLDERGRLEGLSFMPEMARWCGRRVRVSRRAHKTCDRVRKSGLRRMERTVHLEDLRCDGASHGDCQAACLIFWKEAWLERADAPPGGVPELNPEIVRSPGIERIERTVKTAEGDGTPEGAVWSCQATTMYDATETFSKWDVSHYATDVRLGHVKARTVLWWAVTKLLTRIQRIPKTWRLIETIRGPFRIPPVSGTLAKTPREELHLAPGDWVVVKSYEEILATLDRRGKNRGLTFDSEMVRYCGKRARVLARVERIIDEPTGKMMRLPNDCIILEGAVCVGDYHGFCPRAIYPYWREIWMRRADPAP